MKLTYLLVPKSTYAFFNFQIQNSEIPKKVNKLR